MIRPVYREITIRYLLDNFVTKKRLVFNTHHEAEIFERIFVEFIQQFAIVGYKS
jgi:hypothetical protein